MMSNSSRKQNKYEELERIKTDLANQAGQFRNQLRDIESRLAAVTLAIEVWKSKGAAAASEIEINPYLRSLKGLTQVQALIKIAKDSGNNRFKMKEAKRLLLDAGLVKSKKNASTILFTAIQRSEKFKRVAPGEYELLPIGEQVKTMIDSVRKGENAQKVVDRFVRSA